MKYSTMTYEVKLETTVTADNIKRAMHVLIDNGIEESEAGVVLDAIGCTLLDIHLDTDGYKIGLDGELMYFEDGVKYTVE